MARGDHVFVNRLGGIYNHHGIEMGDGSIIYFGAPSWQVPRRDRMLTGVFDRPWLFLQKDGHPND